MPVDIPIGAEDSPESPGDSPESSDFEASPQDAEKFVLALHSRNIKTSNSGSRFLFFIILSPYIKIQCIPQINHGMHCVFLV